MATQPMRRRVVVTSTRTRAVTRGPGGSAGREIDEQTVVGEVLVRSLVHAQLRLSVYACVLAGILIGGLPMLFVLYPRLSDLRMLGLPLPWLLLGVLVYPGVWVGARIYVRAAERNEDDFVELVERS